MMDRDKQGGMSGAYQALLRSRDYESDAAPYVGIYDHRLPCCGCGIGWCSFLIGFIFPLLWYYGTYLFYTECYHDPRERPGLAACAIAALVLTVALAITLIVLLAQRKLLVFVL
ncbi:hypothetical protein BDL97_12G103200 [Sphagnum fallax]|nr:hypothetical protein BDL97_12G103200 [Sphagnum fallax]